MTSIGFTLEEYTEYLKTFPYGGVHLHFRRDKQDFEIFHLPFGQGTEAVVELAGGIPCQVSGNNDDGIVVTLWRAQP